MAPSAPKQKKHAAPQVGNEKHRLVNCRPVVALKSGLLSSIRDFFHAHGYLEVETPVVVPTPALELHIDACRAGRDFLRTSPELHMKRLLCAGYERIFQVGPCFRAGERGNLHNPEFTMLEWYRAKADYMDILDETRELLLHCAHKCLGRTWIDKNGVRINLSAEWQIFSVAGLFEKYAGWNPAVNFDEKRFEADLLSRVEPRLPKDRPVILMDYPAELAALARLKKDDRRLAERWELYLGGIEIANAFSELTDASEQRKRFEDCARKRAVMGAEAYEPDAEFLAALEDGMPECAGIAIGIDRLVMIFAGNDSLDQVIPFR
jgi:lysyl-tRNA synthetase class 2